MQKLVDGAGLTGLTWVLSGHDARNPALAREIKVIVPIASVREVVDTLSPRPTGAKYAWWVRELSAGWAMHTARIMGVR